MNESMNLKSYYIYIYAKIMYQPQTGRTSIPVDEPGTGTAVSRPESLSELAVVACDSAVSVDAAGQAQIAWLLRRQLLLVWSSALVDVFSAVLLLLVTLMPIAQGPAHSYRRLASFDTVAGREVQAVQRFLGQRASIRFCGMKMRELVIAIYYIQQSGVERSIAGLIVNHFSCREKRGL